MSNLLIPATGQDGRIHHVPAVVQTLANNILAALSREYPKWSDGWNIQIDQAGGIVQVRNLLISGKMGFTIRIIDIDPEMRKIRYFAGELLERYRLSRDKRTGDVINEVQNLDRKFNNEAVYDH